MANRTVFIVSDRTGITAETLSHALLTQFPTINFTTVALPFVDTSEKALETLQRVNQDAQQSGIRPLVFTTFIDDELRSTVASGDGVFFDMFEAFIGPLERELGVESSHTVGKSHGVIDPDEYTSRIGAVNYSMRTDDGVSMTEYNRAGIIILGVSRSGKTPTCLYLALHFGIYAANYPITEEDLDRGRLPDDVIQSRKKLFGLTIDPERLRQIREERRANSRYAQLRQCRYEVAQAVALFRREGIPYIDVTAMSIEEIGTTILHKARMRRQLY
ncbi:MAG: kinase/pyrophosphorylase [Gammaproteobacteria bacterium]|nr:kinase/pyrophosphorylase [Gammaproteobacteria bacterium]